MRSLKNNRWATLAIVLIGFFMILLDTTVVNVAIPTLIRDLHATLADVEWVISGFALAYAALLITFGRLGDLYGRRALFLAGLAVFTLASFFSGEASSIGTLIVARISQGVGGAMLSPAVLSIISSTFRGRERASAFGVFGAVSGLAVAVGPILGGWLTTDYTWRWIFRINIPIGLLGLILALLIIPESRADQGQPLDWGGMITSTLAAFALVFGLIEGQTYGWWKPTQPLRIGHLVWGTNWPISFVGFAFLVTVIFLVDFILIEAFKTRHEQSPAVDFRFFRHRTFRYGLIALAVIALGEFSSLFTFPIFLQSIHGFTPLQSGYAVLPLAVMVLIAAPISASFVNRYGSKWVVTIGILLEGLGLVLLSRLSADTAYASLVPALLVLGTGIGLALAQNTQVILSEIDSREAGSGSGVLNTVRQVGTALGIAIIGAVLAHQASLAIPQAVRVANIPNLSGAVKDRIAHQLATTGTDTTGNQQVLTQFIPAPPVDSQTNPQVSAAYKQRAASTKTALTRAVDVGLAQAISRAILSGSFFVFLGALLSLLIPNIRPHEEH